MGEKKGSEKIEPDPKKKVVMSVTSREWLWLESAEWETQKQELEAASSLSCMVCVVLAMGLFVARQMLESELEGRGQRPESWPACPTCGQRLPSKGWEPRQLQTLVGRIS